jgi:hypothetical protein
LKGSGKRKQTGAASRCAAREGARDRALLHVRSSYARRPFLRRPHLQDGRRRGGPAARRPRLEPLWFLSPVQRLRLQTGADAVVQRGGDLDPPAGGLQFLLPQLLPLPLSSSLLAVDREDLHGGGGAASGRCGWGLFVGRLLGFGDAGADGWESIQGRVEAIRWRSAVGRWPWLASAMGPARLAPARVTVGRKRGREKEIRSDRWGPRGRETRREVKGRRAGWLWWAERAGGLAVCANQRWVSGCSRGPSALSCSPTEIGWFFLLSKHLHT